MIGTKQDICYASSNHFTTDFQGRNIFDLANTLYNLDPQLSQLLRAKNAD